MLDTEINKRIGMDVQTFTWNNGSLSAKIRDLCYAKYSGDHTVDCVDGRNGYFEFLGENAVAIIMDPNDQALFKEKFGYRLV